MNMPSLLVPSSYVGHALSGSNVEPRSSVISKYHGQCITFQLKGDFRKLTESACFWVGLLSSSQLQKASSLKISQILCTYKLITAPNLSTSSIYTTVLVLVVPDQLKRPLGDLMTVVGLQG